jgi:hypothetical protein
MVANDPSPQGKKTPGGTDRPIKGFDACRGMEEKITVPGAATKLTITAKHGAGG